LTVGSNPCTSQIFCSRACLCLALFFADASLFPRCRRVAGAPSHLAGRRVAAGGWLQAGGCRQTGGFWQTGGCRQTGRGRRAEPLARWSCAGFFGLLGRRCAWLVWVGLTFKMATGCAVGKYRWDMTPTASAKLTATNTAEKSYELS
jgi:hypothetical protein